MLDDRCEDFHPVLLQRGVSVRRNLDGARFTRNSLQRSVKNVKGVGSSSSPSEGCIGEEEPRLSESHQKLPAKESQDDKSNVAKIWLGLSESINTQDFVNNR